MIAIRQTQTGTVVIYRVIAGRDCIVTHLDPDEAWRLFRLLGAVVEPRPTPDMIVDEEVVERVQELREVGDANDRLGARIDELERQNTLRMKVIGDAANFELLRRILPDRGIVKLQRADQTNAWIIVQFDESCNAYSVTGAWFDTPEAALAGLEDRLNK